MKFWITVKGLGCVFSVGNVEEAEARFKSWTEIQDQEVILFADFADGNGAVIWKRH